MGFWINSSPTTLQTNQRAMGFFKKFKQGLTKTTRLLKTDIRDLFKQEGRLLDDAFLDEMRAILFKTDMGYDATEEIIGEVASKFRARKVQRHDIIASWSEKLKELMAQDESPIRFADSGPTVLLVCGVNGTGKTTSIAKLAHMFKTSGRHVILGAGDTFRAAAVQQLSIWADRLGVEIVTGEHGSHPASVAYRAVEKAVADQLDVCIVDTAGRLQTQTNLMAELTKIQQSIRKQIPAAPHEVLLVLDATTGQNGISQASKFTEAVDCTGIILAKLDGTAKGGVVVAIRRQVGLPVKYVGVGEQLEDLALFQPDEFVDALFDDVK
ncbi:MAG: signal recognition particle-docking protein FtsY [Pirellulales bacterium]|nr:signal recognition particle-docking protein FtsY [Pirellulales bacterium]